MKCYVFIVVLFFILSNCKAVEDKYKIKPETLHWISKGFSEDAVNVVTNPINNKLGAMGKMAITAKRDLEVGEIIYQRPISEMVNRDMMKQDPIIVKIQENFANLKDLDVYCLWFLLKFDKADNEALEAFFDLTTQLKVKSPMLWDKKDALQLRSTQIWTKIKEGIASRKDDFKNVFMPIKEKMPEVLKDKKINFKRWKWITEVVHAREMSSANKEESYSPYMDPLVEFYSYSEDSQVKIYVKEKILTVETTASVKKGSRVVMNDGIKDNVFLLENFGFMIQKNKITFDLSISLDIDDKLFGNKMQELHKHLKFNGSLSNHVFKLDGETLPESLLYALRVYHAEMIDLQDFDRARNGKPLSSYNEKKVLEDIIKFCTDFLKNYPTTRAEDKDILLAGKLSIHAKYAVILRRAEKRILSSIKKQAASRLDWVMKNWNTRPTEEIRSDAVKFQST